jgi:predicted RNase H-like HicB family nuclease
LPWPGEYNGASWRAGRNGHGETVDSNHRREENVYVALCPELDIASQGSAIEEARENLREALELFFETASREEQERRPGDFFR